MNRSIAFATVLICFLISCGNDPKTELPPPIEIEGPQDAGDEFVDVGSGDSGMTPEVDLASDAGTLPEDELRSMVRQFKAENGIPGMSVIVVSGDQQIILNEGEITFTSEVEVTSDARFALASVTKMLTALLILDLVEAGALSLESTIGELAPDVAFAESNLISNITVEQLLRHTSGLGIPEYLLSDVPFVGTDIEARANTFQTTGWETLVEPDLVWNYNNQAYSFLGYVAETAANGVFEDLLTTLLHEIGMTQSGYFQHSDFATGPINSFHVAGRTEYGRHRTTWPRC